MHPLLLSLAAFSLTAFAVTFLPPATAGDLYKWTDDKGRVHYTSTPPPETAKKAATIDSGSLSSVNALPNDPYKTRADGAKPAGPASWAPVEAASSDNSAPTSPPALIPASLLPTSDPPATAKPEQPAQPEIVEVVAQGMGTDANAALLNAYSNAVQQALGLYVDAETMVQNDEIVRDKILTYSKGFIQEASEISKSQANGLFQVNIRAKVKRQKLLEQAKANNISVKAVEGVSLHAQVESQIKQEKDAKALLEKALLPLMGTTFHRAELAPSTQDHPNPTINKEGTDDNFVTLDYKVNLWIDESEYYKYVKNDLIPTLNQIAIRKGELTANYKAGEGHYKGKVLEGVADKTYDEKQEVSFSVLIWGDKALTASKWQWFAVSVDKIPNAIKGDRYSNNEDRENISEMLCRKTIELSLLDEKSEIITLASSVVSSDILSVSSSNNCYYGGSISPIALDRYREQRVITSPYFTVRCCEGDQRVIFPPKSDYFTISVKISKEDIPRVKSAKLEVKSAGE